MNQPMINLQGTIGAPPIAFPGVRMQRSDVPTGLPGGAPVRTINTAGQAAMGCVGCNGGIGNLTPWYGRIPTWAFYVAGAVGAGLLGYGVYRLVR